MKKLLFTGSFLLCCGLLGAQDAAVFKSPTPEFRPRPLWFWNNTTITKEGIDAQMAGLKNQSGYGGFSILPFGPNLMPKYLTEEYFDLYEYTARKAKELGVTLSLYDEYGFPSGSGGAINADGVPRFANRYPALTMKRLDKIEEEVQGGQTYNRPLSSDGKTMAVVAMNTQTGERIDLADRITEQTVVWKAPAGRWKVMQFVCVTDGDPNMDYLSKEAAKAYIDMTHEAYYKRMPEYFGSTIDETFFDEPTLYRAQGRCWTPTFNEEYAAARGSDPSLLYPALWYDIGEETESARNALFSFRAELYASAYPKLVSEWSRAHGTKATGHQDNEEIVNPVGTSADLMKCFKYQDIPGIDKIGGDRPAEKYYKVVSSSAYNWDRGLVMSETYGAMGDIPWDTLYQVAMDQYTKGINLLIPHAAWFNDQDVSFKPELSYRSPVYGNGLHAFNTFLARLNILLRNEDRFVTDVAVLYPIETMQGGHRFDGPLDPYKGGVEIPDMDYVEVSTRLTDVLGRDFLFLHPEVMEQKCHTNNKNLLTLDNEKQFNAFKVLIVPSSRTISAANLQKVLDFYQAGGQVIFTTQRPVKATEPGMDARVAALMDKLLPQGSVSNGNKLGGRVTFVPDPTSEALSAALSRPGDAYDVEFPAGVKPLRYIHKQQANGKDVYYLANLNGGAFDSSVALRGKKSFSLWDPHTGEVRPLAAEYSKKGKDRITLVRLRLDPQRSAFLVENR